MKDGRYILKWRMNGLMVKALLMDLFNPSFDRGEGVKFIVHYLFGGEPLDPFGFLFVERQF